MVKVRCKQFYFTEVRKVLGKGIEKERRYYNYEYNSKKAIIKANNPVASERANPKIAYENNCQLLYR